MEIKNIEAFLLLSRSLNFTKSAEQMFLSQSAFSRQISRLEEELGCQLFNRTKRIVELTEFGKSFLVYAEKIVSEYNKCMYRLHCGYEKQSTLRLGMLNDLIDETFPKILRHFLRENPEIEVKYSDNAMSTLITKLLRDELDCVYTLSYEADRIPELSSYMVRSEFLNVVISKIHPLANRDFLRMEDLSESQFIIIEPDTYNLGMLHNNYLCQRAGFTPNVSAIVSNVNSLMMLVDSNIGIGLVSETAKKSAPEGVRFLPIESDELNRQEFETDIMLIWKTTNSNPAIQKFIEASKFISSI